MQQSVYCIDASRTPALLVCVQLDAHKINVGKVFTLAESAQSLAANGAAPSATSAFDALAPQVRTALGSELDDWLGPIVLLNGKDYLSLNLDLPLSNPAQVGKVIEMEVQDLVPFESQDFVLHHKLVGSGQSLGQDIHVAALPKHVVAEVIAACRSADLEPLMICSPTSAMEALHKHYTAAQLAPHCILLHLTEKFCYLVGIVDGSARVDRIVDLERLFGSYTAVRDKLTLLLQQIALTRARMEKRYSCEVSRVYSIENVEELATLAAASGFQIEELPALSDIDAPSRAVLLSAAACGMVQASSAAVADDSAAKDSGSRLSARSSPVFVNFRTREFAYRAPLGRLAQSFRALLPWLGLTLALVCLSVTAIYQIRVRYLNSLHSQLKQSIKAALNDGTFDPGPGEELTGLLQRVSVLDAALKDLGSPSRFNAVDVLARLSRTVKHQDGAAVRTVSVKGSRVRIEGEGPDYAYGEELERGFSRLQRRSKDVDKQRRKIYCQINKCTAGNVFAAGNSKPFCLELILCE